eukprot:jgi/Chlat1/5215/Chrsp33S05186
MLGGVAGGGGGGYVFVTVGTTSFDALIRVVDAPEFAEALSLKGYRRLILQVGRGTYTPCMIAPKEEGKVAALNNLPDFEVEWFRFKPSLAKYFCDAALVISHAGSGSIFETLHAKRPLIVVVNDALMDNHQQELAGALAERKHLECTTCVDLLTTVEDLKVNRLLPYPVGDARAFAGILDKLLGFPAIST